MSESLRRTYPAAPILNELGRIFAAYAWILEEARCLCCELIQGSKRAAYLAIRSVTDRRLAEALEALATERLGTSEELRTKIIDIAERLGEAAERRNAFAHSELHGFPAGKLNVLSRKAKQRQLTTVHQNWDEEALRAFRESLEELAEDLETVREPFLDGDVQLTDAPPGSPPLMGRSQVKNIRGPAGRLGGRCQKGGQDGTA